MGAIARKSGCQSGKYKSGNGGQGGGKERLILEPFHAPPEPLTFILKDVGAVDWIYILIPGRSFYVENGLEWGRARVKGLGRRQLQPLEQGLVRRLWEVPWGRRRGRDAEKQTEGEFNRTCDCWGGSEGKEGVKGDSQVSSLGN